LDIIPVLDLLHTLRKEIPIVTFAATSSWCANCDTYVIAAWVFVCRRPFSVSIVPPEETLRASEPGGDSEDWSAPRPSQKAEVAGGC